MQSSGDQLNWKAGYGPDPNIRPQRFGLSAFSALPGPAVSHRFLADTFGRWTVATATIIQDGHQLPVSYTNNNSVYGESADWASFASGCTAKSSQQRAPMAREHCTAGSMRLVSRTRQRSATTAVTALATLPMVCSVGLIRSIPTSRSERACRCAGRRKARLRHSARTSSTLLTTRALAIRTAHMLLPLLASSEE